MRGETNSPPLSLLEESNGRVLWCGVEEWMAESDGGAGSCGKGQEVHPGCQLLNILITWRQVMVDILNLLRYLWKLRVESSVFSR